MSNPIVSYGNVMLWKFEAFKDWNVESRYSEDFVFENLKWNFSVKKTKNQLMMFLNFLSGTNERDWLCIANVRGKTFAESVSDTLSVKEEAVFGASNLTHDWELPRCQTDRIPRHGVVWFEVTFDFTYQSFSKNNHGSADIILRVEDVDLSVNKCMLYACSEHFVQFDDVAEFEIEDVVLEEFIQLLVFMHPTTMFVTKRFLPFFKSEQFNKLMKLADRFKCRSLFAKVEMSIDTLFETNLHFDMNLIMKCINFAEDYNLPSVLKRCLAGFKKADNIKTFSKTACFELLPEETKAKILSRLLEFF